MPLNEIYSSRNELIARLVGYSSRLTPFFTGLLRVYLTDYSNSKYSLGIIHGAIVYAEGKREGITLYGGTALRNLLEELANPNISGRIDFIEMMKHEVEAKMSSNPLIALELPVYFGDLVVLIPGYQDEKQGSSPKPTKIAKSKRDSSIVRRPRRRRRGIKIRFLQNNELVRRYSEFLGSYHEHLLKKAKPLGILSVKSTVDLIELLNKYSKYRQLLLASISADDKTMNCIALMISGRIAGIYCDNMGVTVTNRKAIGFLMQQKTGYMVELKQITLDSLYSEVRDRILYSLDNLRGYYAGSLELGDNVTVEYYIIITNNRIIRVAGDILRGKSKEPINKVLAIHILPYILVLEKEKLRTINRDQVREPWIRIDNNMWKYAISVARLLIENYY